MKTCDPLCKLIDNYCNMTSTYIQQKGLDGEDRTKMKSNSITNLFTASNHRNPR